MPKEPSYAECPHCGVLVREGRLACPSCGSDASTGWKSSEEIDYASVEIPDYLPEDFDGSSNKGLPIYWRVLGLITALTFAALALGLF
ncbi:MAG: hypothetical protein AAF196_13175 [Planctomycetota bacterium]